MTYGEMKNFTLQLINQYSIAGAEIPSSYNNQADYVARIPALLNAALTYISTSNRFIPAQLILDKCEGEKFGAYRRYVLPENYWQMRGSGLVDLSNHGNGRWFGYHIMAPDYILVEDDAPGILMMEYFRKPALVPVKNPDDNMMLDCDPETQQAAAYYVAAHLVLYDDSFMYASLHNEFENMMDRMSARPSDVEVHPVEDVYGFEAWAGY